MSLPPQPPAEPFTAADPSDPPRWGLGDVALRVCCFLEGIEAAEQHLGWAARSGKIVLRIALQRLVGHYRETYGQSGRMIG